MAPLKKKKAHRWPKRAQVQRAQEQEAHRWLNQKKNSLSSNLVAHIVHGCAHAYSLVRSLHSDPSRYSPNQLTVVR